MMTTVNTIEHLAPLNKTHLEIPMLSFLAPNLSDAEKLMNFHISNQNRSESPLEVQDHENSTYEIDRMYNPGSA